MNIVVGGSSDDDYSSLSSRSSLGENLDEFLTLNNDIHCDRLTTMPLSEKALSDVKI